MPAPIVRPHCLADVDALPRLNGQAYGISGLTPGNSGEAYLLVGSRLVIVLYYLRASRKVGLCGFPARRYLRSALPDFVRFLTAISKQSQTGVVAQDNTNGAGPIQGDWE